MERLLKLIMVVKDHDHGASADPVYLDLSECEEANRCIFGNSNFSHINPLLLISLLEFKLLVERYLRLLLHSFLLALCLLWQHIVYLELQIVQVVLLSKHCNIHIILVNRIAN